MDSEAVKCARIECVVESWRNPEPECVPFTERQREAWRRFSSLTGENQFLATDDELNAACAVLAFGIDPL